MSDEVQHVEIHPGEEYPLVANFEDVLADGETVASASAAALTSGGASAGAILSGAVTVSSPRVQQRVLAGTVGETYLVVITATTSQGLDYVQRFELRVAPLQIDAPDLVIDGATANSYSTLEEADAYFARRLRAESWEHATRRDRIRALLGAARDLDALTYRGAKATLGFSTATPTPASQQVAQPLAFPRSYTRDADGEPYLPQEVKDAQCEQALFLLVAGSGADRRARLQAQGVTSFSVEGMSETFRSDRGATSTHPWFRLCPEAQHLVARHVEWGVEVSRV